MPDVIQYLQTDRQTDRQICRNSGIELLKILAIIFIVISHVTQSLVFKKPYMPSSDYVIDITRATTDVNTFVLLLFYYLGRLGNSIFFICSAWFLLYTSSYNKKKCFFMLIEIWFISIVILIVSIIIRSGDISTKIIIKSIFPTTFSNNWYLTCYLLFYPLHPLLNIIIRKLNKTNLFRVSLVLFMLYICLGFIKSGLFFSSLIIVWIAIYFIMSYLQQYMREMMNSTSKNLIVFLFGLCGFIGLAVVTNYLGLHYSFINGKMTYWVNNCNPFLIAMAISLFNLMRKITLKSKAINYVSSLSLLIYIIHENIIVRNYFRPLMWLVIYQHYGHSCIILWDLAMSIVVFTLCLMISMIYDKTIRLLVRRMSDTIFFLIRRIYLNVETLLLKIQ